MNQIVKYGLITISILIIGLFVAYGIFINNFDLFGEPGKEIKKPVPTTAIANAGCLLKNEDIELNKFTVGGQESGFEIPH